MKRKLLAMFVMAVLIGFLAPAAVFAQDQTGDSNAPNALIDLMKNLPNVVIYITLTAAALPWLIAVTVKPGWSSTLKVVVTYAWCLIAAALYFVVDGSVGKVLVSRDFVSISLWVFGGSQLFYRLYGRATKEAETKVNG